MVEATSSISSHDQHALFVLLQQQKKGKSNDMTSMYFDGIFAAACVTRIPLRPAISALSKSRLSENTSTAYNKSFGGCVL
eukprot:m.16800 g.16800  ORF g.16800 m.16800 type:complete len:80 (+) comp8153_c0_seq1:968-1207(+)